MGKRDWRYYLNGFCVEPDGVVAADGHRLAHVRCATGVDREIIIPRDLVSYLPKRGVVEYSLRENYMSIPSLRLEIKLIDGTYPDWRHLIPKYEESNRIVGSITDAVVSGRKLPPDKFRGILFTHDGASVNGVRCGDSPFPFKIGFNINYLYDAIKSMPDYDMACAPDRALVLTHGDMTRVIMPMRL